MADNTEMVMSLLSLLGIGGQAQNRSWQSYGGIQKGPVTAIQQARGQISNVASSMLGPFFGPLVGELASDYIVGQDFTRSGALHNNLSGLLAPASGTYANAFQQTYQNQTLRMLTSSREKLDEDLRRDFYTNYYDLTMPGDRGAKDRATKVKGQVDQAMKNVVSIPAALQFLVDPAQNRRAMKGIKDTQAGMLYWQSRMQPKLSVGLEDYSQNRDPVEMAKVLAQGGKTKQGEQVTGLKDMIKNANAWILGKGDESKAPGGYGGFNGASVSELASILQNSANQLDLSGVDQLKKSLKSFEQKVRQTSQALAPLKDIFGEDIKAMTDMIQSVSGQNISQLSPAMIRSIAVNTADVSRYSGATVAQIAQAGQKLFLQSAQIGGSTYSRIGAANSGAYYSALIAQGNAPAGVHAAQYAGNTQRAVASGTASAGADRAAMAYGLWKEAKGGNATVQDFMKEINRARSQGGTLQDAIVSTVNAATSKRPGGRTYNWGSLVQGYSRGGYREFLQSDAGARLGMQGQYQNVLSRAILSLAGAGMEGTSTQRFQKLGQFMLNRKNAALVKDLVTNSNDPAAVQKFRQAVFGGAKGVGEKEIQLFLNNQQGVQEATRYANTVQLQNFQSTQAQLRRELAPLDQQGTGAWLTFWKALSNTNDLGNTFTKGGKLQVDKASVSANAALFHVRALLGATNAQDAQKKWKNLTNTLGKDRAADMAMLAEGDLGKDQRFIQSLRTVARGTQGLDKAGQQKYWTDMAYLYASRDKHIGSKTSQKNFQGQALDIYKKATEQYAKGVSAKGLTDTKKKKISDKYYNQIQRAYRVRNIQKLDIQSLGLKDLKDPQAAKKAFKDLFMNADNSGIVAKLATMDEKQWNEQRRNIKGLQDVTYEQMRSIQRSTAAGYDLKTDVMRRLSTLIDRALNFLSKKGG